MKKLITVLFIIGMMNKLSGQSWHNFTSNPTDRTLAFYFDSTANELYVGGLFDTLQGVAAKNIIKWNGTTWTALGNGFNRGLYAITKYNGEIYAAGEFDSSGTTAFKQPIAKWNGIQWLPLDTFSQFNSNQPGFLYAIHDLVEWNGNLIAGGNFNCVQGNLNCMGLAGWNGNIWFPLTPSYSQLFSPVGTKLIVFQGDLYIGITIGGAIDSCPSSGQPSSNAWAFVRYEPVCSTYVEIGGGVWPMGSGVDDIVSYNGSLYLALPVFPPWAGNFITRYDGTNFFPLSNGFNNEVEGLTIYQGQLIASGRFTADGLNSQPLEHIAVWDGTNWNPFPSSCNLNSIIRDVYAHDTLLFANGVYDSCGTSPVNYSVVYPNAITTGLEQILIAKKNHLEVFPNPANGKFEIAFEPLSNLNANRLIQIFDYTGKLLQTFNLTNDQSRQSVNAVALPNGMYLLLLKEDGKVTQIEKLILNK